MNAQTSTVDPILQFQDFEEQLGIKRLSHVPPNKPRTLFMINAADWLDVEPPVQDAILAGTFDAGDKVAMIASSKQRKTFFVLQMCMHIAAGQEFLQWKVPKPRRVLLIQTEVKVANFHRRFRAMARHLDMSRTDIGNNLRIINGRGLVIDMEQVSAMAEDYGAELIVYDPLYKLITGDENSAEDLKPILAEFDRQSERTGAAVLFVHHDAKGQPGDRNIRDRGAGSSLLSRDYDCCITLTAHRDDAKASVVEVLLRNYAPQDAFAIGWCDGSFRLADLPAVVATSGHKTNPASNKPADEYIDRAVDLVKEPVTMAEIKDMLTSLMGLTQVKARAVLSALLSSGRLLQTSRRHGRGAPIYIGRPDDIRAMEEKFRNPSLGLDKGKSC